MAGGTAASAADSYSADFEDFDLGFKNPQVNNVPIINDPDPALNWQGDGLSGLGGQGDYDAAIVDLGGAHGKVLRQNNPESAQTNNYALTHPTTPAIEPAGETGAVASQGVPASNSIFRFSYSFASATEVEQDGLHVRTTPMGEDSVRQGLVQIEDGGTDGFRVGYWDPIPTGFRFTQLATGLSRSDWHTLSVELFFKDGSANDVVRVTLNGVPKTLNTWENYYESVNLDAKAVDRVIFRAPLNSDNTPRTPAPAAGGGVYFDELSVESIPEPASALLLAAGGLAFLRRRAA